MDRSPTEAVLLPLAAWTIIVPLYYLSCMHATEVNHFLVKITVHFLQCTVSDYREELMCTLSTNTKCSMIARSPYIEIHFPSEESGRTSSHSRRANLSAFWSGARNTSPIHPSPPASMPASGHRCLQ